jgi:1-acyl-sn-glycerol-3-phosphate acyltransferase
MFATFKLLLVWVPLGSLAGIVGIPYTLVVGDISLLYRVTMWIIRTGLRAGGIRVEVVGRERVPNGQSVIFLCNHVSNLDPPVVLPALPGRCSVLLKKELMSIPILGRAMRMAQFVPVERGSRRDAAQASVSAAAAALRAGLNMLVFPEGPGGHLRYRAHDAQRQHVGDARSSARRVAATDQSCGLRYARAADAGGARGAGFGSAGVYAAGGDHASDAITFSGSDPSRWR